MRTYQKIQEPNDNPAVLTIGNFDGVHLGHQAVLQQVIKEANRLDASPSVLTFQNHPLSLLQPDKTVELLCTPEHKVRLLETIGVTNLYNLHFTKEFSEQSPAEFLALIKRHIDCKKLVLGYDARIGKERSGNRETVFSVASSMNLAVEYLDPLHIDGMPVSSSRIRESIRGGDLNTASKLLGRRYSVFSNVISGRGKGRQIGYPTANLAVSGLCLPPFGVYRVSIVHEAQRFPGVANLGLAPTVRKSSEPLLEVYFLEGGNNWYGKQIEVVFESFIRPEQKFSCVEDLRNQIASDIREAKATGQFPERGANP